VCVPLAASSADPGVVGPLDRRTSTVAQTEVIRPVDLFTVDTHGAVAIEKQARPHRPGSTEDLLEELADRMANEDVAFLDAGRRGRGDAEAHVAEVAHLATALARQADDGHPLVARCLDGAQDVGTVAARRDGEEEVSSS